MVAGPVDGGCADQDSVEVLRGDVIVSVNDETVKTSDDVEEALEAALKTDRMATLVQLRTARGAASSRFRWPRADGAGTAPGDEPIISGSSAPVLTERGLKLVPPHRSSR